MQTKKHEEQKPFDRVPRQWESWNAEIEELEKALVGISLPTIPLKIQGCNTIIEPSEFIKAHLATIKVNDGNPVYLPYLECLNEFRIVLHSPKY